MTLQSDGSSGKQVQIGYDGTFTVTTGLLFSGSGNVTVDANGVGGNSGLMEIYSDQANISTNSFTMEANGPSAFTLEANGGTGGVGDGGTETYPSTLTLCTGTVATITANASSNGKGDALSAAVTFYF